jgi:hypothetical protein
MHRMASSMPRMSMKNIRRFSVIDHIIEHTVLIIL